MEFQKHWTTPPAGVDAYDLARASGLLPRFGLSGMGDNTAGTIAAYDPEPISSAALTIVSKIQGFFGGTGHLDANVITPIQNQVVNDVIAPLSAVINGPNAAGLSLQQLTQMYSALQTTEAAWLNFLHTSHWSDSRAATQAEATLAPYFNNLVNWFNTAIPQASTSIGQVFTGVPTTPGLITPTIPGTAGGGNILTAGIPSTSMLGGTSTLMLVGAGVLLLVLMSRSKSILPKV